MKVLTFLGIQHTLTVTSRNSVKLPDVSCGSYPSKIAFNPDFTPRLGIQVRKLNPGCIRKNLPYFTLNSVENTPQFHLIPAKVKHYSDNGSKFIYS